MSSYLEHDPATDPAQFTEAIRQLRSDTGELVEAVRGLLIHDAFLNFYGLTEADFANASRATLDTSARLEQLFAPDLPKTIPTLSARDRQIGTCRDYALLTCSFLRTHGIPARVRCGFATYFGDNRYDDHWICEAWNATSQKWVRIDAQLDDVHRTHLGITFDTLDLLPSAFLSAAEVWKLLDAGEANVDDIGHGSATGEWFLFVNIMRDRLALCGQIRSDWDSWREAIPVHDTLDNGQRKFMATIAQETLEHQAAIAMFAPPALPQPFWKTTR